MSNSLKIILTAGLSAVLLLCCLLSASCAGYGYLTRPPANLDTAGVHVTAGTLEVVVPQARVPDDVDVSPTGRWLVLSTENTTHWFVRDNQTGQERELGFDFDSDLRWLNEKEFAAGYKIVNATDLSELQLEVADTPENDIANLEVLRGASRVYLLPTRGTAGVDVLSGDPAYPYGFDAFEAKGAVIPPYEEETYQVLKERFPETEFVVVKAFYFQPIAGIRNPNVDVNPGLLDDLLNQNDFPSPDGRFYARSASENWGTNLEIYQCGHKLVAHAVKDNWYMVPKGWAYDSSGFYFLLRPQVGYFTAGEVPISILKLNLPPEVLATAPPYEGEGFCE